MAALNEQVMLAISNHEDPQQIHKLFTDKYQGIIQPPVQVYSALMLCAAIEVDHNSLVDFILAGNHNGTVDVNFKYGYATPLPLVIAVSKRNITFVQKLVGEHGAQVELVGRSSLDCKGQVMSAIELALQKDDIIMFKLLEKHYDVDRQRQGRSLLHLACLYGALKCAESLLQNIHLNVDVVDKDDPHYPENHTPLMFAVSKSSLLTKLLLNRGASVHATTARNKSTALHFATTARSYFPVDLHTILSLLINAGADVNAHNANGETPLLQVIGHISTGIQTRDDTNPPYTQQLHNQMLLDAVKLLLGKGAKLQRVGRSRSVLHACVDGPLAVILGFSRQYSSRNAHLLLSLTSAMELLCDVVDVIFKHGVNLAEENAASPITFHRNHNRSYNKGNFNSVLDHLVMVLSGRCSSLVHLQCLNPEFLLILMKHAQRLFSTCLWYGLEIHNIAELHKFIISHQDIAKPFLELFLATLSQRQHNNVLGDLVGVAQRQDREGMLGNQGIYLKYMCSCRSLKALCRLVIFNRLVTRLQDLANLQLPKALKQYVCGESIYLLDN